MRSELERILQKSNRLDLLLFELTKMQLNSQVKDDEMRQLRRELFQKNQFVFGEKRDFPTNASLFEWLGKLVKRSAKEIEGIFGKDSGDQKGLRCEEELKRQLFLRPDQCRVALAAAGFGLGKEYLQ